MTIAQGQLALAADVLAAIAGEANRATAAESSLAPKTAISPAMASAVAAPTLVAAWTVLGNIGTVTSSAAVPQFNITESLTMGSAFYDAVVVNHNRTGGSGHRQAFTAQTTVTGASSSEFEVGAGLFGFMNTGSGQIFGGNTWAGTAAAVASTASCCSFEANTDVRNNITRKAGIQVVDASTSTGDGTSVSTGIYIARQVGGFGYQTGIQFGDDFTTNMGGARTVLIRTANAAGSATVQRGIDFRTATFSAAAIDLPANGAGAGEISFDSGQGGSIQSQTPSNGPSIVFGSNAMAIKNFANTSTALSVSTVTPFTTSFLGSAAPSVDNAVNLGGTSLRWATVFAATGTINTSDGRLKTDVAELPSTLALVAAIKPISFKWKSGGAELVDETEIQTVQATAPVERKIEKIEMHDGNPVMTNAVEATEELLWDEVPLLDAQGQQVIQHVPAQPATLNQDGTERRAAIAAHDAPRTHRIPRMVQKPVAVQRAVHRAGRRTHWGFLASDVKAAMDSIGMDFGGYVRTEDGTEALRPDQMIPVLWRAFQELAADFAAYKATHP